MCVIVFLVLSRSTKREGGQATRPAVLGSWGIVGSSHVAGCADGEAGRQRPAWEMGWQWCVGENTCVRHTAEVVERLPMLVPVVADEFGRIAPAEPAAGRMRPRTATRR